VLINLILNSIDAVCNQADGKIFLRADMDGHGKIMLHVEDNGAGILEEAQDKIFIPFFTTKKNGSGIGLSLSQQIMRLHRGNISVYSKPNEYTIFTLKF
jgi:two-component system, NtrC family, nitrogen regulation sensor histidine kinase NtrY